MSFAGQLVTGGLSVIFAAATAGLGFASGAAFYDSFREAALQVVMSDVVGMGVLGFVAAGAAIMTAGGAFWFGKETIHPDPD